MAARGRPRRADIFALDPITPPPLPRVRLDSLAAVRRELARLYTEAKHGHRNASDASKLGNILALISRILEGEPLERRLEELEKALAERQPGGAKW
jgi:hypothetical protein